MSRDIPVAILAAGVAIAIVLLALSVLVTARAGHSGWSIALRFKKEDEPPLDQSGSTGLSSEPTTEAPSPGEPEHP